MCVTDHHDMTLAVKVALDPNTINELKSKIIIIIWGKVSHIRLFTNKKKFENNVGKEKILVTSISQYLRYSTNSSIELHLLYYFQML